MARIRVVGTAAIGQEVAGSAAMSILNSLLAAGAHIRHDCGGKALCGTCAVKVVGGRDGLSPLLPQEASRLAAAGRGAEFRLACQTRAARDVEIEIPSE